MAQSHHNLSLIVRRAALSDYFITDSLMSTRF